VRSAHVARRDHQSTRAIISPVSGRSSPASLPAERV
jgi:hypothetical protein